MRFVTVNTQPWDHHGTADRLPTEEGAKQLIPPADKAIASLIRDLDERGMLESTLVVAMGEFGRTPRMNSAGGRDHWGHAFSVLMAGGRYPMGQVIGSSDKGMTPSDRPVYPQDLHASIFDRLGIDPHGPLPNDAGIETPITLPSEGKGMLTEIM